jgi:hypothetical protein
VRDDETGVKPSPIDPALLKLPSGYESTGDPVDGNPFPAGTVRHELWATATREAEQEIARLKAAALAAHAKLIERLPGSLAEMDAMAEQMGEWRLRSIGAEFEAWTKRAIQVVFTDADVRHLDGWLVSYAEAILRTHADHMLHSGLPQRIVESELSRIRQVLATLVLHWKAESRRARDVRAEQKLTSGDCPRTTPDLSRPESPPPLRADRANSKRSAMSYPNRAAWFQCELDRRDWSVHDLRQWHGPDWRTSRRVLQGLPVKSTVLGKIVRALSEKGERVSLRDVPHD